MPPLVLKRAWLVVVALVTLTSAGAVAARWLRSDAAALPSMVLEKSTFVNTLDVRGEIRPVRSTVLTAPSSGTDLQIIGLARNGSAVAAGEVVIEFDSTSQQRTLEQKQSELKQAQSEVEKAAAEGRRRVQGAEASLGELRSMAARARLDLARTELVSKVEAEKLGLALSDAEEHVRSQTQKLEGERRASAADATIARQKRDKAAYDVSETQRIIASLSLRSPSAGQISLMSNFRAAQFSRVAPEFKRGDRVWFGAPIAELPDLTSVRMTCRVDEADRARVQPGAAVRVRVDAIPDRDLPGKISQIAIIAKPDFTTFPPVRNFDVSIALDDSDPRIRSGMSASGRIDLDQLPDVIVVPDTAVFTRNGETIAYVITGRAAEPRRVTVARRSKDRVAITAGLQPGERIALRDPTLEAVR